jgi:hypothetical protein
MTFDDQMRDHRSRCQRQLSKLRMLTLGQDAVVFSTQVATEIRDATNAIIAETEAMSRAVLKAGEEPGAETFLWVRVTRLAQAADQAVMAAQSGQIHELRTHLHHFDALTAAIWTVQRAVHGRQLSFGRGSHVVSSLRTEWPQVPRPREPQSLATAARPGKEARSAGQS